MGSVEHDTHGVNVDLVKRCELKRILRPKAIAHQDLEFLEIFDSVERNTGPKLIAHPTSRTSPQETHVVYGRSSVFLTGF